MATSINNSLGNTRGLIQPGYVSPLLKNLNNLSGTSSLSFGNKPMVEKIPTLTPPPYKGSATLGGSSFMGGTAQKPLIQQTPAPLQQPPQTFPNPTNNDQTGGSILPPISTPPPVATGTPPPDTNPFTAPTPTFSGAVGALAGTASQPSPQYVKAQEQYLGANKSLADLRAEAAQQEANIGGSRTNLAEAGGEQGLLQNLTARKEAALTGEMTAAQAAAQAATGQQATQQQGLGTAAGLGIPQQAGPTNVTFNPLTRQYENIAAGAYQNGGVATIGGIQEQMRQGSMVQDMTGKQKQAQALAKNLSKVIMDAGINPASAGNSSMMSNYVNGALQWIEKNTGNPQYQNFANLINEISSRYAYILNQAGGTPTDQSTLSHQIINSLAGGSSIIQVLSSLDKNANDSINALRSVSSSNFSQSSGNQSSFYNQNWITGK